MAEKEVHVKKEKKIIMHRKRQKDHVDKIGTKNWPVMDGIIIGFICISK
jgi:hypothetical protein